MKKTNGITLIALVITIVLMLILASITVTVAINGGLFEYAGGAKDSVEIANEKDIVSEAFIWAESNSKTGRVTVEELQKNIPTDANATVMDNGDTLVVKFNKSDRYYQIANSGNIEYLGKLKEKAVILECVDSTGKVIASKNINLLWERYSITLPQVEGYEPSVETLTGEIGDSETIQALYYQIFQDDTTLVFTGLDSSGNITTDEASIVSYMVGDGSSTDGNGLLEKTVLGILKIPENYKGKIIKKIGYCAFGSVSNLVKVDTGDSVEKIDKYAFYSMYNMTDITIGKNINAIENRTINCKSLKSVMFKNSMASYANTEAFYNCVNWTEIKIDSQNTAYKVIDNVLYSADGKTLIKCPHAKSGEFIVPDSVEKIEKGAFYFCGQITKMTIPDSVKTIEAYAFSNTTQIQEFIIGKNVTSYGNRAFILTSFKTLNFSGNVKPDGFYNCVNWTEIIINSDNTTFKVENNILYSYDGKTLFIIPHGKELEEYIVPDTVEIIDKGAADMCSKLKSVIITDNVTSIGSSAFLGSVIESITIGKNVTSIGANAFTSCSKLKTVIIDSAAIAGNITAQGSYGNLVNYAETIYIKEGITPGSYITDTTIFKKETSDKEGYVRYVKIS